MIHLVMNQFSSLDGSTPRNIGKYRLCYLKHHERVSASSTEENNSTLSKKQARHKGARVCGGIDGKRVAAKRSEEKKKKKAQSSEGRVGAKRRPFQSSKRHEE
ncbi:uncharacterized protein LOC123988238 [Osmia bicornis bicornis]|uniref:uncharacterized protein LOC123988238 n=1 Tax=Osmia bicornis bicornis TaxID=1437191 RepID=UPI001EAF89E0|nr:uncharacterized protein LOC123988238 [Osmia bicornis bicornis]